MSYKLLRRIIFYTVKLAKLKRNGDDIYTIKLNKIYEMEKYIKWNKREYLQELNK